MFVQASVAVVWMYWYVRAGESRLHEHTNALYSLRDDASDDGLAIVRNM